MKKRWFLYVLGLFCSLQAFGQEYDSNYYYGREFRHQGDTLAYRVLYPEGYEKGGKRKFPLIIFLHGRGESGSDNQLQLKHGSALFTQEDVKQKYPAIVIFPQCPERDSWAVSERDAESGMLFMPADPEQTHSGYMVERLIRYYLKNEPVDAKRVYIMGLSMGGMGTLDLLVREPKMFAAAISICGAIEPTRLKKLKKMPIRFYHGTDDPVVPVSFSRDAFYELKAAGSRVTEIIEYPGVGHDSWDLAFGSADFLEWLFSHKK